MYRSIYDSDVSIFSPQGRIHQVEYAMEAVKHGSVTVGAKNDNYAVLLALKRSSGELSSYQEKVFKISDHIGVSISGLISDAKVLCSSLIEKCINYEYAYSEKHPIQRLVTLLSNDMQQPTMQYGSRAFGVGLLLCGYDKTGPRIFQICPSANAYDCLAMAIGNRSQTSKTYLEDNYGKFAYKSLESLILFGMAAIKNSLQKDITLSEQNISIAVVGKDTPFTIYSDEETKDYIKKLEEQHDIFFPPRADDPEPSASTVTTATQ